MMELLGQVGFAFPAALWALAALPVIFWLLRTTPPRPREVRFPPLRLLEGLKNRRREPARTPWWLLALRMALAAALVVALAGPRLLPRQPLVAAKGGPWLVLVDDGWAAARNWTAMKATLAEVLERAREADAPVAVAFTTPRSADQAVTPRPPDHWRAQLAALAPQALSPQRRKLAGRLARLDWRPALVIWLADGVREAGDDAKALARALASLGAPLRVHLPRDARLPLALTWARGGDDGIVVGGVRAVDSGARSVRVSLRARNGRLLTQGDMIFHPGRLRGEARLKVPVVLRNAAARLEIAGQGHAGAVWLLGDGLKRKTALVISGDAKDAAQSLLSSTYYVTRALMPFAEVREASDLSAMDEWLKSGLSMLVLADVGALSPQREKLLLRWVRAGGMLVRFAGERIANASERLLPVRLRGHERELGASLSWQQPQPLARAFPEGSPLAGLAPDPEVRVRRQVLAEPDVTLAERTWASLADGTPLITARAEGKGRLVLVHVTASPDWSNLPLSGLFVRILKRLNEIAPLPLTAPKADAAERVEEPSSSRGRAPMGEGKDVGRAGDGAEGVAARTGTGPGAGAGVLTPRRMLDAFGALVAMPPQALPVPLVDFDGIRPSPEHPAGLYARGGLVRALNVGHAKLALAPLSEMPAGTTLLGYAVSGAHDLAPYFFMAAAALFLLDLLAMAWLTGGAGALMGRKAIGAGALALALLAAGSVMGGSGAWAQSPEREIPRTQQQEAASPGKASEGERRRLAWAMRMARNTRLAHVLTGKEEVDELAHAGLAGLSRALFERTSVEPDPPVGVDIERDDISVFPLLYWPVTADAREPSPAALRKLDIFLKHGGTILFDTRDAPDAALSADGMTPRRAALQRILRKLDIPPLEPAGRTHVLTRSFYLLKDFPGRYVDSPLWVEATSIGRERRKLSPANADGVSAVLITGNDFIGAWAISASGRPLLPVVPGGARQREMAYRTGINIVMYALTGNYKADQVHLRTILQRLGQ